MQPQNLPVGSGLSISVDQQQVDLFRVRSDVWELRVGEKAPFPRILHATASTWIVKHPSRPLRQFRALEDGIAYAASKPRPGETATSA